MFIYNLIRLTFFYLTSCIGNNCLRGTDAILYLLRMWSDQTSYGYVYTVYGYAN